MNLPDFTGPISAEIGEHEAIVTTARLQALQLAEKRLRKVESLRIQFLKTAKASRLVRTIPGNAFAKAYEAAALDIGNILVST